MLTRRGLIGAAAFAATTSARAAILTDDGLYRQPWFLESFLELGDDLQGATGAGKRFAIMWELRGCPYCRETHLVNFARPDIEDYVKTNFEVLQLNIIGSRKVTDFDGKEITEKALAAKYAVRFTFDYGCYDIAERAKIRDSSHLYLGAWYTVGKSYGLHDGEWKMIGGAADARGSVLVSSEPLTHDTSTWFEVPEYSAFIVTRESGRQSLRLKSLDA